ncbi:MAG TPA: tyrosinase family protein [Pyrinomonadaceae bacterium]|nr:tyrosinase family protein [Pyrinomonadaceae bacterium]
MRTEITINGRADAVANYIPWTPAPCRIRLADAGGLSGSVDVILRNRDQNSGGQVLFYDPVGTQAGHDELRLTLPTDGSPVDFFAGGKFGHPSAADQDAAIEVTDTNGGATLSLTRLMVRIRKDANTLTDAERDRFVLALATLNDRGMGRFSDFRNMHRSAALDEAHGDAGFLPWHRAYLLDLERELQNIDPAVALPYWRFDRPAPRIFTREFLGASAGGGTVRFSPTNPLQFWVTDNATGIRRTPRFNPATQPASNSAGPVIDEQTTLRLGEGQGNFYEAFVQMEGQPHGRAHVSFTGYISNAATAPQDPLFFLLHANADRLWAKWQWFYHRFDTTSLATYSYLGSAEDQGAARIGHNLQDTMWPWNQDMIDPRPSTAPGGAFAASAIVNAPGASPAVFDMIDFQGILDRPRRLGFDYDDVPFEV